MKGTTSNGDLENDTISSCMIRLHCQFIMEAIRNNQIITAMQHAQENLHLKNYTDNAASRDESTKVDEIERLILETMGLLAYTNPEESPVSNLLNLENRTKLAEMVNRALLAHHQRQKLNTDDGSIKNGPHGITGMEEGVFSKLERASMQLQVLSEVSQEEGIGGFHSHLNPSNIIQ